MGMADHADVVVIGGGSSGASIAWNLVRHGAGRVILLEQIHLAAGGTGRSSAIVRTHYTHEALARMAHYGLGVFANFKEAVDPESEAEFHRTGFLVLVGPQDVEALMATVAMHRRVGIATQALTAAELAALEPRMAVDDVGAAAWEPQSGYADPHGTVVGFARAAQRAGAIVRTGMQVAAITVGPGGVTGVETSNGPIATRTVVVAAGYRTRTLLAPHGIDLPLTPVRHTIAIVRRTPDFGAVHPVLADFIIGNYGRSEGAELSLLGATAPLEGVEDPEVEQDRPVDPHHQAAQTDWFVRRFPSQTAAVLQGGYTGVYDCSPDSQPLLGPLPEIPGLHIAAGLSGHGFKLSPAIGELIAEQILVGRTSLVDIGLFSAGRFTAGQPIVAPFTYSVPTPG